MAEALQLIITGPDFKDVNHWRWELRDAKGSFLADQEVNLDRAAFEYRGYQDLPGFLRANREHYGGGKAGEKELLRRVGAWMGEHVLGKIRPALLKHLRHPATNVRVVVPVKAQELLFRSLELAHIEADAPLVEKGVRFIYQRDDAPSGDDPKASGNVLRVLAVFSLPTTASPLNLRRERVELKRLLDGLVARRGVAIETRVLQYGATRDTLRKVLREAPGWDIVHFSCHGWKGSLLLENDKGEEDLIPGEELSGLLNPTQDRLKLLILSACWSAAGLSLKEARELLGLDTGDGSGDEEESEDSDQQETSEQIRLSLLPSLAQELSHNLDCAVLAMRYPVEVDFAANLVQHFFTSLLEDGQPVPGALRLALDDTLGHGGYGKTLSPFTPIVFGPRAVSLTLTAPPRTEQFEIPTVGLIEFPPEPERFVGRLGPMLRASQAFAPNSEYRGVLFYGMAGAGKTACGLELAYRHEKRRFTGNVFFKCPNEGEDISTALVDCLHAAEVQLNQEPGAYTANADDPERFREYTAPRIKALLQNKSILFVIDNMESLLTSAGGWRDAKWGDFLDALFSQSGPSRVVLTSRRLLAAVEDHPKLLREPIHALSFMESLLLAQELPHLGTLLDDEAGRDLLTRALEVIQGHPKLLELADSIAVDRARFERQVARSREEAKGGAPLQAFFEVGETQQDEKNFIATLNDWTATLVSTLSPTARLIFYFLCRLEDEDLVSSIIEANWKDFLTRLKDAHPDAAAALNEDDYGLPSSLELLVARGLVGQKLIKTEEHEMPVFNLHPGVAEAGRKEAGDVILAAADIELGDFHIALYQHGIKKEMEGGGRLVVQGGRRATPYLMRSERWREASTLIEMVTSRDGSPATLNWAIPLLRRILEETRESGAMDVGVLAKTLRDARRYPEAEALLRKGIDGCAKGGKYRSASSMAGHLVNLLFRTGRLGEALSWSEKKIKSTLAAGLGPWTQLADEGQRLQVLCAMGEWRQVLDAVEEQRKRMEELPEESDADEAVNPWNVREVVLDTGHSAALGLKEWETALRLNAEIVESKRQRDAGEWEVARKMFDNYGPLLQLHRLSDVRQLLESCRSVFDREHDYAALGKVYGALADLEDEEGQPKVAARLEMSALKYNYQSSEPETCGTSHNNLSNYLERTGEPPGIWLPHLLAGGLIRLQVGSGELQASLHNLALSDLPAALPLFDEVADALERIEGVRFRDLFARLPQRYPDGDAALAALWQMVKEEKEQRAERKAKRKAILASMPPSIRDAFDLEGDAFREALKNALQALPKDEREDVVSRLRKVGLIGGGPNMEKVLGDFEPLLHGIASVAKGEGDTKMRKKIESVLPDLEKRGWQLTDAVRRIWDGERDGEALTANLDEQDTQLVRRILELVQSS